MAEPEKTPDPELVQEAVLAFIEADTWADSRQVVEKYRDLLLTDLADQYFVTMIDHARDNPEAVRTFQKHRALLARCRREGIDIAFEHRLGADSEFGRKLDGLVHEISSLNQPGDMPRRIELCQAALEMIQPEVEPELWAALHDTMGLSLVRSQAGERAGNIERAIYHYRQALQIITVETMPEQWVEVMNHLAAAYPARVHGDRGENLEQAIALYFQLLRAVPVEKMTPESGVMTTINLGNAYRDRLQGDRSQNVEVAISLYRKALESATAQAMPDKWTQAMINLAAAYISRIQGDRAENLEQAIQICEQVGQTIEVQALPFDWAQAKNNLAIAYQHRLRGERAENLEQAIVAYQACLTVFTRERQPDEWATAMNNLGAAYRDRLRGERAENLERAIDAYQQALEVETRQATPWKRAQTLNNLGIAYWERIHGSRAENLERAIDAYRQALEVRTREAMPLEWSATMINLAAVYGDRIEGERAANLERAIGAYEEALAVITRETMPLEWAIAKMNLAITYADREQGDRAENLATAVRLCEQALTVRTREAMPVEWAQTINNLGAFHRRAGRPEEAIAAYEASLTVYSFDSFPADHQRTQIALGSVHFDQDNWPAAYEAYQAAMAAGETLLAEAYTETGRRAEVGQTGRLYARAAYCLLQLDRPEAALQTLEQGKTRLLAEALALADLDLTLLPEPDRQAIQTLRTQVRTLEAEMRLPPGTPARRNERDLAAALGQARSHLSQQITEIRREIPDFLSAGLEPVDLLGLIPPGGALVIPLITQHGSAVFVIPHGTNSVTSDHVLLLSSFTETNLDDLLVGSQERPGWLLAYVAYRHKLSQVLKDLGSGQAALQEVTEQWQAALERITGLVGELLLKSISARLEQLNLARGASLLLLPQGGLGLLPLHAAWRQAHGQKRYWLDDYAVTYVPSGYARQAGQRRLTARRDHPRSLLAVVNPTRDLQFTPIEGEQVVKLFGEASSLSLEEEAATLVAVGQGVRDRTHLHFSCHGFYHWQDVMQSGLLLANGERLTLAHLISDFDLKAARLVVLSACETGLTDIRQSPDEFIGLPAGFLQAGAPGVVSTLWAVEDLSTMLLMEKFYSLYLQDGLEIAEALRQAQIWLREVTAGELAERFTEERQALLVSTRMPAEIVSQQYRRFKLTQPDDRPFEHPYYWAAFTFSGA